MERNGLSVDQGILVLVCFSEGDQLLVVAENGRGIFFLASTLMVVYQGFSFIQGVPVVKPAFSPAVHCTGVRAWSRQP